jgi:hypothetical protein
MERRLETLRVLALARQLEAELGSRNAAGEAMGIDPTYLSHLRGGARANIGGDVRERVMKKLDLSGRFFDDPGLGDAPDYRKFQGSEAPVLTSVDLDEDVRTALIELLAQWDEDRQGPKPSDEEVDWLRSKLDFRTDRRAGLEITASLLFDRLRERRKQQRGKAIARPALAPPPSRTGTRKLSAADNARKKGKGR